MAEDGAYGSNEILHSLLTNVPTGDACDSVAQLLAAAVAAQISNSAGAESSSTAENIAHDVQVLSVAHDEIECDPLTEVPSTSRSKRLRIKIPVEVRKQIISMRKEGKKCVEVAKELPVSVSGAQKVWERFLATGTVHDRRPSTYAGRPRRYSNKSNHELKTNEQVEVTQLSGTDNANMVVACTDVLDVPGATVEVVETDHPPLQVCQVPQKGAPQYRQHLLLTLIKDCPLAVLRADKSVAADNPHITNLAASMNKPLYMEYVLGHPFGKAPSPQPFDGCVPDEAQVILSDPMDPVGKDLLAKLGYSTKVYFNACCKPSPLFDKSKILSLLPFYLGPGYLVETLQAVAQLLLDMCLDPDTALKQFPEGDGFMLFAKTSHGITVAKKMTSPQKLSEYWSQLYNYASLLGCCENFLSASKPSAPCLLCHPFQSVVKALEIQDDDKICSMPGSEANQSVEIHVLESGQIDIANEDSSLECTMNCEQVECSTALEGVTHSHFLSSTPTASEDILLEQFNSSSHSTCKELSHDIQSSSVSTDASTQTSSLPAISCSLPISSVPLPTSSLLPSASSVNTELRVAEARTSGATLPKSPSEQSLISPECSRRPSLCRKNSHTTLQENDQQSPRQQTYNLRRKRKPGCGLTSSCRKFIPKSQETKQTLVPVFKEASATVPDVQKHRTELKEPVIVETNPLQWNIEEVAAFIDSVPRCSCTQVFQDHEVDGESLLTLDPEMMVKLMNIKTGPALRIYKKIVQLKKKYNIT